MTAGANFLGVFGHVAIDTLCSVNRFPAPNTCEAIFDRRVQFGGTAGNICIYAASLGVKTAIASFVGEDMPEEYRDLLQQKGVDITDLVKIEGGRTPAIILVSNESHDQIGYVDQGVMEQEDLPLLEHSVDSSEILHIGTGRPGYAHRMARYAKKRGKRIAFDPAQEIHYVYDPDSFSKVVELADMFFCNSSELTTALRYLKMSDPGDLLSIVDTIVITLGRDGSKIMTRGGDTIEIRPCSPRRIVETTGAGDAYRAGFYAGLQRGLTLDICGTLASAAASFAVENFGAQNNPPNWAAVEERALVSE